MIYSNYGLEVAGHLSLFMTVKNYGHSLYSIYFLTCVFLMLLVLIKRHSFALFADFLG